MRVFLTKHFAKFARREQIRDASLAEAVERAVRGLVDADLGGGIIKQRVARLGHGRSGGYRTLIAFRAGDFAVFVFGFSKSERANVGEGELASLQSIASQWLGDGSKLAKDLAAGILIEVEHDGEFQQALAARKRDPRIGR